MIILTAGICSMCWHLETGLADDAGTVAYITRSDPKTGEMANYVVDLEDLIKNGNMAYNHPILGGDVIFIPESGYCFCPMVQSGNREATHCPAI